jgi:hypothetical protein
MRRAKAIVLLTKERKWVRRQHLVDSTPDEADRAYLAMTFAVRSINACGARIDQWLRRREGRLTDLRNVRGTYTDDGGNRTLGNLLLLAIVTLEAAIWVADVPCREYPVSAPRTVSEENLRRMLDAKQAKVAAQQEARRRRFQAEQCAISEG